MNLPNPKGRRLIISACLLGLDCTFTGVPNKPWEEGFRDLISAGVAGGIEFIPVCPEQLGGMPTPRPASELVSPAGQILKGVGRVRNEQGEDVTAQFLRGARTSLMVAKLLQVNLAVLKARSPSCGLGTIHSGKFDGSLLAGNGLTAELFMVSGIRVLTDEEFLRSWREFGNFSFLL